MKRNKDNKKKSYKGLVIAIDLISIGIIVACILMDTLWINNIEYELVSVSIDSFLALIAILSSFVIPYAENRTYQKYNLSNDDLNNIRGDTKTIYINLLVASIIMFAADAIFYMFDLALSLFGVILVGLLFICVFVAPRIVEYAKGEDAVIKTTRKKCNEYVLKTPEKFDSSEKLIVYFVLENGFEKAFNLLLNGKKETSSDETKKYMDDLFVFLIKEQTKYLNLISSDPNIDDILTSKVSNEFMRNLFYLSSKNASENIKDLDVENQHEVFSQVSMGLHILSTLIKDENLISKFKNQTTLMLLDVLDSAIVIPYSFDDTYFYFLTYLFAENLNNKNIWFIDAFADLCYRHDDIKKVSGRCYVLIMFFQLIGYLCRRTYTSTDPDFEIYLKNLLTNKCRQLRSDIEHVEENYSFSSLYETFIKIRDTLRRVHPTKLNWNNPGIFTDTFFLWTKEYFLYTVPLSYYKQIERVDELIWRLSDEQKSYLISYGDITNFGVPRYQWDLKDFVDTLNSFNFLSFEIDYKDFLEKVTFIHDYKKREAKIDNLRKRMGFGSLAQDFMKYEKDKPGYVEDLSQFIHDPNIKRAPTYMPPRCFYINKNVSKSILKSDESPVNIEHYFSDLIYHSLRVAADASFLIDNYNEKYYKQIKDFHPKYKHAPSFDKYCERNNICLEDCIDIALYPNWVGEVFFKENVLFYHIDFPKVNIRQISLNEAVNIYFLIKEETEKPSFVDKDRLLSTNISKKTKLEQIDVDEVSKILSTYYYVSLDAELDRCVIVGRNKALSYEISSNDR